MQRRQLIEQILRQVYADYPRDESVFTPNFVNQLINQGIGIAVKQNQKDAIALDGVSYINNSFYTTFKGISITQEQNLLWKVSLPQVPMGIGQNEGVSNLRLKKNNDNISTDCIPLTINQKGYASTMKRIPNRVLYYTEGDSAYILSTLLLNNYTADVTMISGGDSTDLTSTLNVPDDYIPVIVDYVTKIIMNSRMQPRDLTNDGADNAQRTA